MKKTVQIIAVLLVVLCIFTGCSQQGNSNNKDERVDVALAAIDEQWDDYQIKNTRIITIKDNDVSMFDNIDYIVEFVLYTDYYGSAPYYSNAGIYDTVSVNKDGRITVNERNLFDLYRSRAFVTDFSDIIGEIKDLGSTYNN